MKNTSEGEKAKEFTNVAVLQVKNTCKGEAKLRNLLSFAGSAGVLQHHLNLK